MGCGMCRSFESVSHIKAQSCRRKVLCAAPIAPAQSKLFTVGEELSCLEESEYQGKQGKVSKQSTEHAMSTRKL